MFVQRIAMVFPYAVMLALAAGFYRIAQNIQFTQRGDYLGPDFWPRLALALIMVICLIQGGRLLLLGRADDKPSLGESFGVADDDDAPRSNLLFAAGLTLTVAYGALVTVFGFMATTFAFMVLFMYAGKCRSHLAIWLSSAIGICLLMILFQRVVYVSLPRGIAPFNAVSDFFLRLF